MNTNGNMEVGDLASSGSGRKFVNGLLAALSALMLVAATPAVAQQADAQEMLADGGDYGVTNKSANGGDYVVTNQTADAGDYVVTNGNG
jgi:hypothetical protein